MNTLSVIIIAKNEENNIIDCIESVEFASEIIVVDDNSYDNTAELAKKHGAKVCTYSGDDDFSKRRNFGLEKAGNEWVLFVDADERVSLYLQKDIKNAITQEESVGYYLKRQDYLWGKPLLHGETAHVALLRLGKKTAGRWSGAVHEVWDITGKTSLLPNALDHYPHQTITEFLTEINQYTTLRAQELHKKGVTVSWLEIIIYPKGKFVLNYLFRLGFLDGIHGLVFAILMSFHSFLVRGKLWTLWQKK